MQIYSKTLKAFIEIKNETLVDELNLNKFDNSKTLNTQKQEKYIEFDEKNN
jgi:hypothetical protein